MKIDADQVYFTEKMLKIKHHILNSCDAVEEDNLLSITIQTYKSKHQRKNEFYSLSGVNIILGKDGLSVPTGSNSKIPIFNGTYDRFIISPNSNDRYYHTERYEMFKGNEKVVISLGLCWIHTGFIKRCITHMHTSEIKLSLINNMQWKQILPYINCTHKPVSYLNNELFWNYDIGNYFTQKFYDKYFPGIENYARKHFQKNPLPH